MLRLLILAIWCLALVAGKPCSSWPSCTMFNLHPSICPGKDFGDATVWLAAVNMLAAFDIRKARDDTGREVTPIPSFSSGMIRYVVRFLAVSTSQSRLGTHNSLVSHVRPFVCDIRPRSQKVAQMIELVDISN